MKRTPLKRISAKQRIKNKVWADVKLMKLSQSSRCEWCGLRSGDSEFWQLDAHHKDGNRNNNTYENCVLLHRTCHTLLHDGHIKWEDRDERTNTRTD